MLPPTPLLSWDKAGAYEGDFFSSECVRAWLDSGTVVAAKAAAVIIS